MGSNGASEIPLRGMIADRGTGVALSVEGAGELLTLQSAAYVTEAWARESQKPAAVRETRIRRDASRPEIWSIFSGQSPEASAIGIPGLQPAVAADAESDLQVTGRA